MTDVFARGIRDVSKHIILASPPTRVVQCLPAAYNQSFRYHTPRRISISAGVSVSDHGPAFQLHEPVLREKGRQNKVKNAINAHLKTTTFAPVPHRHAASYDRIRNHGTFAPATVADGPHKQLHIQKYPQSLCRNFHSTARQAKETEVDRRGGNVQDAKEHKARQEISQENVSKQTSEQQQHSQQEHFYDRIHMPQFHRPSKEELLAAATGFWARLKVRFKWLTIKSTRPFNVDEIVGFISWIALGHVIWIVIGTTTFVSLAILAINTVFAQETLAGWIGNYLTKSSGLHVVFESAIVPKWRDGVITFKNVFVSRRPGKNHSRMTKGSPEAAAQASSKEDPVPPEEQNYTQFDITIGEVNVTLSFSKWWNSKGPLQNVEVKHVRGVVDRTHVFWTGEEADPKSYRHEHKPGDFEIDSFKIEDLLVTVYQPEGFRPFAVSIYNAELPRLRKQWLFYDFLCANNMTGEFDRSLFTIHPRQTHAYTGAHLNDQDSDEPWKKQSRIRIDGLNIDHLNRGASGPLSWIHEGNVDIVADIMIPNDSDESVIKVMTDFYERMEAALTSRKHLEQPREENGDGLEDGSSLSPVIDVSAPAALARSAGDRYEDKQYLVMDLRIHLNDVRAVVPLFTRDLSYINNALIRPIVAYINSRRTFIPINCRVVKRLSDFDGSWTLYDSGLMDDLSAEVYDAFARDVQDEQARLRRFKKVGLWSLQLAVQAIFLGMAGNIA
ncbi:Mitochondrial distribution and morphology protein 31, mitochondrial precursor [Exophiala dermatitidis]|uniref:Mitochondrial distribution and morphology protein 31, mitochondrial n=1 Tax=Exophiala dermatitidis TaxID=5970 RepID=A0AAN6IR17_EXODE|nr:Mitochondrial distribution and morphology protein 31, mitochondrial precursor [Exophiala dermatitidis]KAJ4505974.1 Mitochondrial distribution and morphology protein 31, mitochondrial precursor [Exophiala dermatitidis]KAJ4506440.1 Mitochondrial distribution and morphology protein 31, mitochondrial precursor [Exophiala dermatitidis]KAJ4533617.1 Mitochondrial distribution and morphology protein 31, mitochondrial precursor [Exophiala dermatitidis]KAJ4539304.1 Mitochondrial distribution and morph